MADVILLGLSTQLCQTRFRIFFFFPGFGANANTNQKKMNNGSKCYSTATDEKASFFSSSSSSSSLLHTCRLMCTWKEETSIIIEMGFFWFIFPTIKRKRKPGKKKISFLEGRLVFCSVSTVCGCITKTYRHRYRMELKNLFRVRHTWQTQVSSTPPPQLFFLSSVLCVWLSAGFL